MHKKYLNVIHTVKEFKPCVPRFKEKKLETLKKKLFAVKVKYNVNNNKIKNET